MKTVVVGGVAKDVGKTSVVEQILAATRPLDWTAVKITLYGADEIGNYGSYWRLRQETTAAGDTARFLAAGARRALWLTAPRDQFVYVLPSLAEAVACCRRVIVESTSILEFWNPDLFILVTGGTEVKPSAHRFFSRAGIRIEGRITPETLERVTRAIG